MGNEDAVQRIGPFHAHDRGITSRIVGILLHCFMFGTMVGLGGWEISMFSMNTDVLDSTQCKIVQIRNIMLANGIIDIISGLVALLILLSLSVLFTAKVSLILATILGFVHILIMIASVSLMITNSILTWSSSCNIVEPHFYNMVSVMYIVMWSVMGSYFIVAAVLTLITRIFDIKTSSDRYMGYGLLNTNEE
jgi:hypothetical protein